MTRRLFVFSLAIAVNAGGPAAALEPEGLSLSSAMTHRFHELASALAETPLGRLMLAEASSVKRLETTQGATAIRHIANKPPFLAFNRKLLDSLGPWEAELILARELALASMNLPLELHEGRMAACQKEMEFALDLAAARPLFGRILRRSFRRIEIKLRTAGLSSLPEPPSDETDRVAYYQYLFARDPEEFYWAVERQARASPEILSLRELEDFMERYPEQLGAMSVEPRALYTRVQGRRYRTALVLAVQDLLKTGGLERIHEALGPFESVGATALKTKLNAWLRTEP